MKNPTKLFSVLLCSGFLVTLSAAVNPCPSGPVNGTSLCANRTEVNVTAPICSNTLEGYACSNESVLASLPDNLLVNLSSCYDNRTALALDRAYFTLLFSKLNNSKTNAVLSQLSSQFSSFALVWKELLLDGIWPRMLQNLNASDVSQQWIPSNAQPFLFNFSSDMVQCLQHKNASCAAFQELVKNLNVVFPNMTSVNREYLYPALKSFLKSRQNLTDSACSQNVNSNEWIKLNFGKFVQFANFRDFSELNKNFKALDALSLLTLPQMAAFSVDVNNSATVTSVLGAIQNSDALSFLGYINAEAMMRNMSALSPPMAQALLSKIFEAIKPNVSTYTVDQWTQLFQDNLTLVLSQITPGVLSIIPQTINCSSYQVIIKALNSTFNQMVSGNQQNIYNSFIMPFLKKPPGSTCARNSDSLTFLTQNLGHFSQFANYSDLVAFDPNLNALDLLPVLTVRQRVDFSLMMNASTDSTTGARIVGTLQNTNDLYDFLTYLNIGVVDKNISSVNAALSQALLNKTFDATKANFSTYNISDWTQLFQNKISVLLPQISSHQLDLIPLNITCDTYQVVFKSLNTNFPKMNSEIQGDVYRSLIKNYLAQNGPACAQKVSSSALLQQFFGSFSQFANYKDFVALNANFSGGDVLSSLTMPQVVEYSLDPTISSSVAAGIIGLIKNVTDGNYYYTSLNTNALMNNVSSLSPYLTQAILTKAFQLWKPNFNSYNTSDWTALFEEKLRLVLPKISKDQLILMPSNISCESYHRIFKNLESTNAKMGSDNQRDVYKHFIKPYLKQKGNAVNCYDQNDTMASAWFVKNIGKFMNYTSEEDLLQFANYSMLQTFANDPSCIQLASSLNFSKETGIYFTSLLTSSQGFNLSSIPDTFLCYLTPSALTHLNAQAALDTSKKINKQCYNTSTGKSPTAPTSDDVQVAISLVSKLDNVTSDTLTTLGQSAVGLSAGQIDKISDSDLQASVSTLSSVTGWNVGQTRSIMNKLLNSKFQIQNLGSLGSLVTGLPSKKLKELSPASVLNAVKDAQFTSQLSSAPPALKNMFVTQIVAANATATSVVQNVPSSLASFIPKSFLLFTTVKPSLQDVNGKSWSPDQASMFFDDIATTDPDYTKISSSVLQGFTCATPNKVSNNQVKMLAKAMKTQNATLSEDQLTCLSRHITKTGYPTDLTSYPQEVFLFLNSANYSSIGNCTDFFTNIGKANINVLPQTSKLRSSLLTNSLSCMNVSGTSLTDSNIQVLGQLSCDLNSSYIANSAPSILTQLSQCQSFTASQQSSILTLLGQSNSVFGAPSTWTSDTLQSLGKMNGFLNKDILTGVPKVSFRSWMKTAIESSTLTRSQFATIVTTLAPTIARRATGCTSGPITASNVNDNLLPLSYSAVQLDACLDNATLVNYLSVLSSKAFSNDQLTVLKNKLDALYPSAYPDSILSSLGAITVVCTDADVNKWNISSVDTFSTLLAAGPSSTLATSIIAKYISSGNQLNGAALNVIGSQYICLLSSAQLSLIDASAISDAKALDISACPQTVKDALYGKAKSAYQAQVTQVSTYFSLIKPYLGGASVADLKALAPLSPNMDIGTFVKLNPSAVLGLTVTDVKGLLGNNTVDLKTQLSNSVVSNWIAVQKQADLDTLGLGIQGGIRDYVTTKTPASSTSTLAHGLSVVLAIFGIFLLT